jgi:hypothetical protein
MKRQMSLFLTLIALLTLVLSTSGIAQAAPSSAPIATGYYTIFGHEGIGTIGSALASHGTAPAVGDYNTTYCRYIDVPNTTWGQYWLIYPLHLPNGVTITEVSARIADFNATGAAYLHMVSRPWNSRGSGSDFAGSIGTTGSDSDEYISRTGINTLVNNGTTQYWIEITPVNSADPGQLCVYSIRVTYTYSGAFLPIIVQ